MLAMPLTNSAWEKNFRLQAATTGGNPVPKGDRGRHVAILRKNLEAVGFERSLEPSDFYGPSTADMIRDFRLIYDVPGKSELVDKALLETLDAILNKKIPQRRFKAGPVANMGAKGKDFALKYLPTTKQWVDTALKSSRRVEQTLTSTMNSGPEPDFPTDVYQPFMQHFRLQICIKAILDAGKGRLPTSLMLAYNDVDEATKTIRIREVIGKVNKIANVFGSIKAYLDASPDTIFVNSTATSKAYAECDINKKVITFYEKNFFEVASGVAGGMDRKSASWVTIHESAHAVLQKASLHGAGTGPGENPYSHDDSYYGMTWQQATNNPDSYAHFAYQIAAGKQNLGPWA
jgi:hypothetical protein